MNRRMTIAEIKESAKSAAIAEAQLDGSVVDEVLNVGDPIITGAAPNLRQVVMVRLRVQGVVSERTYSCVVTNDAATATRLPG